MILNAVEFRDINNEVWADIAFEKRGDKVICIRGDYYYDEQEFEISREQLAEIVNCFSSIDNFEKEVVEGDLIIGCKDGTYFYDRGDYENGWEGNKLTDEQVAQFVEVAKSMMM